jgi:hypothetical protein
VPKQFSILLDPTRHISILWILHLAEKELVQTTESQSDVALKYFDHWARKEYDASARYLDENLSFTGPIDKFNNAHDYVESIRRLAQIVTRVHKRKTFVDGNDCCFVYDLATNTPAGTVPCAEWIHIENGKVKSIEVFFDARPFAAMFAHK